MLSRSSYAVEVDDSGLWPLPRFIRNVTGYAGGPGVKIDNGVLREIWDAPSSHEAMLLANKAMGEQWKDVGSRQFDHDVMRSVEPGVRNRPGVGGYASEIIINVPCKLSLLAAPEHTNADGYSLFRIPTHS